MQNEKPSETIPSIAGAAEGMTTANLPAMPMGFDNFYYLSTVIPDTSKPYTIAYGGVNSDSYLLKRRTGYCGDLCCRSINRTPHLALSEPIAHL